MSSRFAAVLAFIDAHTGESASLKTLSAVAACSPFHFHRQFSAALGMSVHRYVLLSRMKHASYLLAFRDAMSIDDIASRCGYEAPESFARAFRQLIGASPSAFRAQPDWLEWNERFAQFFALRSTQMNVDTHMEVELVNFPETRVALLEHCGDPRRLNDSIARFIDWRRRNALPPRQSATFNLLFDDPNETPTGDFRFGLCVATARDIAPNDEGIVAFTLPAGPCARLRHQGSDDHLEQSIRRLYADWLPQSGRELRDFPLFLQRLRFYPEVSEQQALTDIFLPLVP